MNTTNNFVHYLDSKTELIVGLPTTRNSRHFLINLANATRGSSARLINIGYSKIKPWAKTNYLTANLNVAQCIKMKTYVKLTLDLK